MYAKLSNTHTILLLVWKKARVIRCFFMSGIADDARNLMTYSAIIHSRENRMPAQIAEVRASGYIPPQSKKSSSSFEAKVARESGQDAKTNATSRRMDASSPRIHQAGRIFDAWRRMGNEERYSHKRDITR